MTSRSAGPQCLTNLATCITIAAALCLTGAPIEAQSASGAEATSLRRRPVRPGPIRSWLRTNGIPLDSVEGTGPTTDLLPLSPWIGGSDIIGLGDGTHGTHEYYTVKQRMIQFFAETGIARTVVFEGPWPEFLRVNDYIHDGDGDPRELMKTDYYFFWEYEEMIDLIEWARAFNSTRAADEQIEFLGFDVLTADTRDAADLVIAYLGSVDSAARSAAVNSYQCVPGSIETTTCGQNVTNVRAGIEQNREAYEASSSTREYLRALQSARVVESTNQYLRTPGGERDPWRDTVLAEYAGWFAEEWTGEERLVLWAHNEHIGTLPAAGQWKSLGQHLQDRYGERYFSIGTCMLSGSLARSNGQEVTVAEMQPPIETNYELQFAKGGFRYFLIPLFMPDVPTWLTGPANLRFGTASYDPKPNFLDFTNPAYSLPNKFDAIIFIKETTPCTPIDAAGTNGRRRLLHHFPQ